MKFHLREYYSIHISGKNFKNNVSGQKNYKNVFIKKFNCILIIKLGIV